MVKYCQKKGLKVLKLALKRPEKKKQRKCVLSTEVSLGCYLLGFVITTTEFVEIPCFVSLCDFQESIVTCFCVYTA